MSFSTISPLKPTSLATWANDNSCLLATANKVVFTSPGASSRGEIRSQARSKATRELSDCSSILWIASQVISQARLSTGLQLRDVLLGNTQYVFFLRPIHGHLLALISTRCAISWMPRTIDCAPCDR